MHAKARDQRDPGTFQELQTDWKGAQGVVRRVGQPGGEMAGAHHEGLCVP